MPEKSFNNDIILSVQCGDKRSGENIKPAHWGCFLFWWRGRRWWYLLLEARQPIKILFQPTNQLFFQRLAVFCQSAQTMRGCCWNSSSGHTANFLSPPIFFARPILLSWILSVNTVCSLSLPSLHKCLNETLTVSSLSSQAIPLLYCYGKEIKLGNEGSNFQQARNLFSSPTPPCFMNFLEPLPLNELLGNKTRKCREREGFNFQEGRKS